MSEKSRPPKQHRPMASQFPNMMCTKLNARLLAAITAPAAAKKWLVSLKEEGAIQKFLGANRKQRI